jgi:hypothetical protein
MRLLRCHRESVTFSKKSTSPPISGTWRQREDRYSERREALNSAPVRRVEMNYVGG